MTTMRLSLPVALAILTAGVLKPQQQQDKDFARLVTEWTTSKEFISPVVDHLPKVPGVPTPKDVLGYYIGAPKKLTHVHVKDIDRYYRALAASSKRVKVLPAGL